MNKVYSKLKLRINAAWIILFWLASQILFHLFFYNIRTIPYFKASDISFNPVMHLNEFLIGNLAGLFFMAKLKDTQKNYLSAILINVLLLVLLLKFPAGIIFHNGFLALLFVSLILFISLSNDKVTKLFNGNIFIFLGEISFGVYITKSSYEGIYSIGKSFWPAGVWFYNSVYGEDNDFDCISSVELFLFRKTTAK